MSRRAPVAAAVLLTAGLTGCTVAGPVPRTAEAPHASVPPYLALDSHPAEAFQMDGLTAGVLEAVRQGDTGCAWLSGPDGQPNFVLWPEGFRLRSSDLALVDGTGSVVAHIGERVSGGGGLLGDHVPLPLCGYEGSVWEMFLP